MLLTIGRVLAELAVSRTTWHRWKVNGRTPRITVLPNGIQRIQRSELDRWSVQHTPAGPSRRPAAIRCGTTWSSALRFARRLFGWCLPTWPATIARGGMSR